MSNNHENVFNFYLLSRFRNIYCRIRKIHSLTLKSVEIHAPPKQQEMELDILGT